jgi:hypothetical protein
MKKKHHFGKQRIPRKSQHALTPAQKTAAKARAKAAGRPYPNLVDNSVAKRTNKK